MIKSNDILYSACYVLGSVIREEWDFLYNQATELHDFPEYYLEVGSHSGGSITALAARLARTNSTKRVISVDNASYPEVSRKKFRENMDNVGLSPWIEEENISSLDYETSLKFSLIFLDGDHSYDCVKEELIKFDEHLVLNGVFCGHDYQNYRGLQTAVDNFFTGNDRYETIVCPKNMWARRRIK